MFICLCLLYNHLLGPEKPMLLKRFYAAITGLAYKRRHGALRTQAAFKTSPSQVDVCFARKQDVVRSKTKWSDEYLGRNYVKLIEKGAQTLRQYDTSQWNIKTSLKQQLSSVSRICQNLVKFKKWQKKISSRTAVHADGGWMASWKGPWLRPNGRLIRSS